MLTEAEVIERVESRHKFQTPAKNGPNPSRISVERYGHHASYVTHGTRVWGFVDSKGRARFALDYAKHAVVIDAHARHRS